MGNDMVERFNKTFIEPVGTLKRPRNLTGSPVFLNFAMPTMLLFTTARDMFDFRLCLEAILD